MSKRTSVSGRRLWQIGGMGLAATAVAGVLYVLPAVPASAEQTATVPTAVSGAPAAAGAAKGRVNPAPVLRSGRDLLGSLLERRVRRHRHHEGGRGHH